MSRSFWQQRQGPRPVTVSPQRRRPRARWAIRPLERCEDRTLMATALGVTTANALIRFDTAAPAVVTTVGAIAPLQAGEQILGLDFRPTTGELFGLGSTGRLYTIDPATAAATERAVLSTALAGAAFGVDFNPVPDLAGNPSFRVVSDADQNLRINAVTGAVTTDTAITPDGLTIVASAYANIDTDPATGTTLYGIDSASDSLLITANANGGVYTAVGAGLGVGDVTDLAGFDILTAGATNTAFAALSTDGASSSFYTIDLTAGTAALVGPIGSSATPVRGLTIVPEFTPAATLFAVDSSNNLIRFPSTAPTAITLVGPITGLQAGEDVLGIDFRPTTGQLFALGSSNRLYTIDPATAAITTTLVLTAAPGDDNPFTALGGDFFGVDFNPVPDLAGNPSFRVVSDAEENLRINASNGQVTTDTNITTDIDIEAVAYNNIDLDPATGTTIFGISFQNDTLVTAAAPNNGVYTAVGPLGVTTGDEIAFDIQTIGGVNTAFLALSDAGTTPQLYTVNLTTGATTLVGNIGAAQTLLSGLAVASAGTLQFSAPTYLVDEDGTSATITVNRVGGSQGVVTVQFSTTDGTATAPADYTDSSQTLIFGPGVTSQVITIPINDDASIEMGETIALALASPTGGAVLGTQATAVLTIVDDEVLQEAVAVGLTDSNALVFFSTSAPGVITATVPITGLVGGDTVVGIDFRPATGQLYGLGGRGRLYTINPTTGAATQVGADGAFSLVGGAFGFDFNPVPDRIRVVSDAEQDLRLNPNDGSLTATDGTIAFAAGDPNAGVTPDLVASAYINNFAGTTATTLFGLDTLTDSLVIQNPPNAGTLNTVGPLGLDVNGALRGFVGFDVRTQPGGANAAFAALPVGPTGATLYAINLTNGTATALGPIGGGPTLLRGLAILPPVVLNPSALALDEGQTVTLGVSFTPTDPAQPHTVRIIWGDGTPDTVQTLDPGVSSVSGVTHTYADNSPAGGPPFTVRATVTSPGGTVGTASQPIAVANVAPTLTISGANTTQPGISTYTLNLSASDPGADTIASWTIDWGDGTTDTVPGTATTATHVFARCGTFTISATATDEDGTFAAGNAVAVVADLATRNQCFVASVYADVLGRPVDGTGLSFWASELDRGATRADVVLRIEQTPEARTVQVQGYFQLYLGRAADNDGLAAFTAALQAGTMRSEDVIAAIVGSPEYFANAGGTNDAFLEQAYQDLLGRPLDGDGRAGWTAALAGGMTRTQVARAIVQSEEGRRFAVDGFFRRYLDRPADGAGLAAFAEQLRLGATYEAVIAQIIGSQEYLDRFVPA